MGNTVYRYTTTYLRSQIKKVTWLVKSHLLHLLLVHIKSEGAAYPKGHEQKLMARVAIPPVFPRSVKTSYKDTL